MGVQKKKALFFVPHADDLEFGVSYACIEFLRAGYAVKEILMTNCEYGIDRTDFKGPRLQDIRMKELDDANQIYDFEIGNYPILRKMGYTDGFLPLNRSSIERCIKLLSEERPNIIFAPDPIFSIDFHDDHINTGRIPLLALEELIDEYQPKAIFLYYTYNPNFRLKLQKGNLSIAINALKQHQSQISPRKLQALSKLLKLRQNIQIAINGSPIQKLRKLNPQTRPLYQYSGEMNFKNQFLYDFYFHAANPSREVYYPTPKELGIIN